MKKFWKWKNQSPTADESGHEKPTERVLELYGTIAEESWFDDEITPRMFKDELFAGNGPITIWINSPGGDCVAASQIYSMLMDYKDNVTVKIDGIAASAASVIAMAGTKVLMAPTAMMMIHNPLTAVFGNYEDMQKAIEMLDEVKESIINAYAAKTGMRRSKISELMSNETWMNAKKALDYGFCDEILFEDKKEAPEDETPTVPMAPPQAYSSRMMNQAILNQLGVHSEPEKEPEPAPVTLGMDGRTEDGSASFQILMNQLEFLR